MSPHPEPEVLTAFVDDELAASAASDVRAHLDGCPGCAGVVAAERTTRSWLHGLPPVEPPSAFYAQVMARGPARRERGRQGTRFAVANIAAAAAVWVGVVGVARLATGSETVEPALGELVRAHAAGQVSLPLGLAPSTDAVPAELASDYRLVNVRITNGRRQALYTDGDRWVSMFLEPGRLDTGALPAGARRATVAGAQAWVVDMGGDDVVLLQRGDTVVVLVGADPQADGAMVSDAGGRAPAPSLRDRVDAAARGVLDSFGFG